MAKTLEYDEYALRASAGVQDFITNAPAAVPMPVKYRFFIPSYAVGCRARSDTVNNNRYTRGCDVMNVFRFVCVAIPTYRRICMIIVYGTLRTIKARQNRSEN